MVFGVFPVGSANDFARAQGITSNLQKYLGHLSQTDPIYIDCGKIVYTNKNQLHAAYFLNICEVGFGAEAVKKINNKTHFFSPDFSFLLAITQTFLGYKKKEVSLNFNGSMWKNKLLIAAFANSNCFGGGLYIAPDASIADGLLDVAIIGEVNTFDYFLKIGQLKKKQKIQHPKVQYTQTQFVEILSTQEVGIEADGEYLGTTPATVEILPLSLLTISSPKK